MTQAQSAIVCVRPVTPNHISANVVATRHSVPSGLAIAAAMANANIVRFSLRFYPIFNRLNCKISSLSFWYLVSIQKSSSITNIANHKNPFLKRFVRQCLTTPFHAHASGA